MITLYLSLLLSLPGSYAATGAAHEAPLFKDRGMLKVYPTPKNEGSITVQSAADVALTFYLFDLEGTLLYQLALKKNEKHQITGLTRGTYVYNAFVNDEEVKGGKIDVK